MHFSTYFKISIANHSHTPTIDKISNRFIRRCFIALRFLLWILTHMDLYISKEKYFPKIELLLTRSCPFNCKTCIHFLPDYKSDAVYESAASVNYEMDWLLHAIKRIDEIVISGGDALSYPHLSEVVNHLLTSKKIKQITIVTTGTISPTKELIDLVKNDRIKIKVDNYGRYSDKIEEFTSLRSNRVEITEYYDHWDDYGDEKNRNKSTTELCEQYNLCKKERYCILNGKIYACPREAHGDNLGFFACNENEFVDLRKCQNKKEILQKIRELRRCDYLTACNHCNSCTEDFKTYTIENRYKA